MNLVLAMFQCSRERSHRLMAHAAQLQPAPAPDASAPEWWDAVLADPRVAGKAGVPIQQRRLSEVPQHVLRVECSRCLRVVEIQKAAAVRLYGAHAVWKDVGQRVLDNTCPHRTGRHKEDGCWPNWTG
jgi:hypothetical protein